MPIGKVLSEKWLLFLLDPLDSNAIKIAKDAFIIQAEDIHKN